MKPRISVAMTTYNGEKYIVEQLTSIAEQTREPNEVIICDDGSSDSTRDLIREFIASRNLDCWHLFENDPNLGWKRNFFKASKLVTGDIVFFSDQDDIWLPDKIKKMVSAMAQCDAEAVYGESIIINASGEMDRSRNEKNSWTGKLAKIPFSESFNTSKTLGCRLCVSRRVIDLYLKLNRPESGHDSQCGRIALLLDGLYHIDEPVIKYRIHANNSSGVSSDRSFGSSTLEKRCADIEDNLTWLQTIIDDKQLVTAETADVVDSTLLFQYQRHAYLTQAENAPSIISLIKHRVYYSSFSMFLGDFAYRHGINEIMGKLRWSLRRKL